MISTSFIKTLSIHKWTQRWWKCFNWEGGAEHWFALPQAK